MPRGNEVKLNELATIKMNYPKAHFWLIRRGSIERCGEPTKAFNKEHIGIRVRRIDILLPDYLFYALKQKHQQGVWKSIATGSLSLVNIRVSDVRNIELSPR